MGYYGIVVPAFIGHLNPIGVLGRALKNRGHRVALISPLDAETKVGRDGLEFIPIAAVEFPQGGWTETTMRMGSLTTWKAQFFCGRWLGRFAQGIIHDLPEILAREQFDGIVMDQVALGAEAVCAAMKLPMAVACAALMLHFESGLPPIFIPWQYRRGWPYKLRNLAGQMAGNWTGMPVVRQLIPYRLKHRLPRMRFDHMAELPPSLVQVAQQPAWFDFPRKRLPNHVHYTGPWKEPSAQQDGSFPWERLDRRPLIYASLGTLQNRLGGVFRTIAEACVGLPVQLVIALGAKGAVAPSDLAGDPIVVDYAPQVELLARASLVITHGGLNTVLESLGAGLPMIALPITNDQPGVASRIEFLGLGRQIPIEKLTAKVLREAVVALLSAAEVRLNARKYADKIVQGSNQIQAAELVERALTERRRITRAES